MRCHHAVVIFSTSDMHHSIDRFVVLLFCAPAVRKKEATFPALQTIAQGMFMYHPSCLHASLLKGDKHVIRCHRAFEVGGATSCARNLLNLG